MGLFWTFFTVAFYGVWFINGVLLMIWLFSGAKMIATQETEEFPTWNGQTKSVNQFCEENDICPICIVGSWNCRSDHK